MPEREGRAVWPSLFVCAAAGLCLAASLLAGEAFRWTAIALLAAAAAPWRAVVLPVPIAGFLVCLCGWMLLDAMFVSPAYSAEALFRPAILIAAFAALAAQGRDRTVLLYKWGVALLAVLVALGLAQHFFGFWHLGYNPLRAAATFVTPNTFAAAINLFLLPLIVVILAGRGSALVSAAALWLFAGLVATQSRGGMLALLASLLFLALCLPAHRVRRALPIAGRLVAGCAAVWLAVVGIASWTVPQVHGPGVETPSIEAWTGRATWDRAEIFATTFQLIKQQPLLGAGASMFWPAFEPVRPDVFGDKTFLFAHNDYLQIWLEYGVPGLALLLGLVAAALVAAWRSGRAASFDPLPLACGAGLASCFAHAFVDYPLYVPFTLFVVGGLLGALVRATANVELPEAPGDLSSAVRLRALSVAMAVVLLSGPVVAQIAARQGLAVLARGDAQGGIYWQSVARRVEPRNPTHYWAEAVVWRELGVESGERRYFSTSDRLLAEGIAANPPYSINLMLERARLHRRHASQLDAAASPTEILAWVEQALARAPKGTAARIEKARALANVGRREEARALADQLLRQRPDQAALQRLVAELK